MRRATVIAFAVVLTAALAALAFAVWPAADDGASDQVAAPEDSLEADAAATPDDLAAGAPRVALQRVAGEFTQPLYVTAPPDDHSRLFVVDKPGRILIVKDDVQLPEPFLDVRDVVSSGGEQGLLSMAFHPRYAQNGRFFVNYTDVEGHTRVVRYTASAADPDSADPASRLELLVVRQPFANHNGGQIQFGPDGRLYVGMGDGGGAGDPGGRAQDPQSRHGKLLRIGTEAGSPPVSVYATGLRNPWRFSFDRETGALWIADVGQNAREEVNYLPPGHLAGANFGWNGFEGSQVYDGDVADRLDRSRLVWPVHEYGHDAGRSITGGYVYRGEAIPALRGHYVFGDYVTERVWAMDGPDGAPFPLAGADRQAGALASFGEDAAGELYVASLTGAVYRLVPAE